jgi:hypothetical protein
MLTCKQMTEMATDRAEGTLGVLDRLAFDRHVARCDGCRAYVRQLGATQQALGRLPEPEISPALNDALLAQFDAWAAARQASPVSQHRPVGWVSPWPLLGAIAMLGLLVAFARQRSLAPNDWWIGSVLALAAFAMAAAAGRFAVGVVAAAVSAALAAALVGGGGGAVAVSTGVECVAVELAAAAFLGGAGWLGARRGPPAFLRRSIAAGALAGALVADAALQVTCGAHDALPHLLVFHVGGVVVAAAGALVILLAQARPASA